LDAIFAKRNVAAFEQAFTLAHDEPLSLIVTVRVESVTFTSSCVSSCKMKKDKMMGGSRVRAT
jgi:hypothetical protein